MLKKLLKYDLKYNYKMLLLFYCLIIAFAIVSKLSSFIDNELFIFSILNMSLKVLTFSMIAVTLMYNMTRLWTKFRNSVYGDESYLTHTLPVTKKDIYLSKILAAIITITTSVLVSLFAVYIIYGIPKHICCTSFNVITSAEVSTEEHQMMLQETIEENQWLAINGYKKTVSDYFMNWISILIFSIWLALTGYFAIINGSNVSNDKKIESIIWGISLFFLGVCFNYLLMASFYPFGKDSFTRLETTLIMTIYYGFIIMIYYILGLKQLKYNINVN